MSPHTFMLRQDTEASIQNATLVMEFACIRVRALTCSCRCTRLCQQCSAHHCNRGCPTYHSAPPWAYSACEKAASFDAPRPFISLLQKPVSL